jgi:hypothetical protein
MLGATKDIFDDDQKESERGFIYNPIYIECARRKGQYSGRS